MSNYRARVMEAVREHQNASTGVFAWDIVEAHELADGVIAIKNSMNVWAVYYYKGIIHCPPNAFGFVDASDRYPGFPKEDFGIVIGNSIRSITAMKAVANGALKTLRGRLIEWYDSPIQISVHSAA